MRPSDQYVRNPIHTSVTNPPRLSTTAGRGGQNLISLLNWLDSTTDFRGDATVADIVYPDHCPPPQSQCTKSKPVQ